jgi:osmoprotectant transport system ATP-binding protein
MTAEPMLSASRVVRRFGAVTALDGVSLDVHTGECVALVGESGSGKSTLLRTFNRLTDPEAGTVRVNNEDVKALDAVTLRRRIGYVPQDGGLLPHWTVLRNAALVPWLLGRVDVETSAAKALTTVGLPVETYGARWPHQLSGGQRQRVAIARALAAAPRIILLDEPFGALDAITRSDLQQMFATLRAETGIAALLVTHDLNEACLLADRIAVMRAGRIEQVAPPRELVSTPATAYVRELLARAHVRLEPAP